MLSISLYDQVVNNVENDNNSSNISSTSINDKSSVVYNEIAKNVLFNIFNQDSKINPKNEEQENEKEDEIPSNNTKNDYKSYLIGFGIFTGHLLALVGFKYGSYALSA